MSQSHRIDAIVEQCRSGRRGIASKFEAGGVHPKQNKTILAWGQYIDVLGKAVEVELGSQYGIYGTAAAVEVLSMQSIKEYEPLVAHGLRVLPLVGGQLVDPTDEIQQHFVEKGDLYIVYKIVALLDAATAVCATKDRPAALQADVGFMLRHLLEMRIPTAGWPDYKKAGDHQGANPHATAVALLAVSRCHGADAGATKACLEALHWFKDRPLDQQSIVTLSMLVVAMNQLGVVIGDSQEITAFQTRVEESLQSWIRVTSPLEIKRSLAATEHWQPEEATRDKVLSASRFDFLIYLPHCIAGLAVLSSERLRKVGRCRRFVVQAVALVAQGTTEHGHFVAAGRSLVSPVEHLWLYRLLREFEETNLYQSRVAILQDRIAERRWGPSGVAGAVASCLALVVAAAVTHGTVQLALTALTGVLVTLGVTVVAVYSKRLT